MCAVDPVFGLNEKGLDWFGDLELTPEEFVVSIGFSQVKS
jgi:hypothetical protein